MPKLDSLSDLLLHQLLDALRFIRLSLQPHCALAAENLSSASNWFCTWSARSRLAELVMLAGSLWYCFPVCLHGDGL